MSPLSARTGWARAPNALASALARRRALGLPTLDLTTSNPTTALDDLGTAEALAQLAAPGTRRYDAEPLGSPTARHAVARYYAAHGVEVDPAQVVLTASTSEAYGWLFKLLCDPGDRALVAKPSYPLFEDLARLEGVRLDAFALERDAGWALDLDALRAARTPRTRALCVVHPNNPTGTFVRRDERAALVELAAEHRLAIVADEVFLDFAWRDDPRRAGSFAAVRDALTFTLSGLSKVVAAPQVKLGWIVVSGPPDARAEALARLELIADCYLSVSASAQHAAAPLLDARRAPQARVLARVEANRARLAEALSGGSPITQGHAEGGWYATLQLPRTRSEEAWSLALLDAGVLAQPGWFYDFAEEAWLVLSLLTPEGDFAEGLRILAEVVGDG
ncbi:MAG: pyridoxal phosphate-dependent aminotransferase [Polyangiales bacterium]